MDRPGSFSPRIADAKQADMALRPTRVRWRIIALLLIISGLTYIDRLNLSIAGKFIQDEYHIGTQTMGVILSAFVLGYALFQVPAGWVGDRYGPRGAITWAILWWSVFTAATAVAPRLPLVGWFGLAGSFVIVRFLVGVGEAAAYPNASKIVAFWMGAGHRGVGSSLVFTGIGLGGALTPTLIAWVMQRWGWRASFYLCASLGIMVAAVWRFYATDRPEDHPHVNPAELELLRSDAGPAARGSRPGSPTGHLAWSKMLSRTSVWALILSYFCIAYPAYIYYTWFYIYLVRVRGLTLLQGGFWGSAPFLAILLLAPLGGWTSDRLVARIGKRRGRQFAVWLGVACSATLLWAGAHAANNTLAILLLAGAAGFNHFATASWWAACIDLTRNYSGSLSGLMNMCGNLGGWLAAIGTAFIATRLGWTQALDFAALLTLIAGVLWIMVNAEHNLEVSLPKQNNPQHG
jgi:MFS transporter, ACS family, glucarate transporter